MQVITVGIQKGGVGKTSIAWSLWNILQQRGYRVLGIDADSQCNFSFCVGLEETEEMMTLYDVITQGCSVKDAIHSTSILGSFIPGSIGLVRLDKTDLPAETIKGILAQVQDDYDFVVIDSAPNVGTMTANSLVASDWVVVPILADIFSATAINAFLDTTLEIPSLRVAGLLLNRYSARQVLSKELTDGFKQIAVSRFTTVFESTIRNSVTLKKAQASCNFSLIRGAILEDLNHFVDELLKTIGGNNRG